MKCNKCQREIYTNEVFITNKKKHKCMQCTDNTEQGYKVVQRTDTGYILAFEDLNEILMS